MTSSSHVTADWSSPVSVANELAAQHSNAWLVLALAVRSVLQKPSFFPSSTCIDLLWGDSCMLYGGYFMYVIFVAAAVYLTCSQQNVCGCIGSSKSRSMLCRRSRSILARPNTLKLSCTLPCNPSKSCHDRYTHIYIYISGVFQGRQCLLKYWVRKKNVEQDYITKYKCINQSFLSK